uniref:Uncharacterized protein n=1 Tax=Aegilops tauschii subsp. strangulata TaxID=200361 RepID=A0A453PDH3_AEGTS
MSCAAAEAGLVAMDCVVVCCCCPCLVLQITVFLFVRLPRKVVVKSKRVFLRRWHRRRRRRSASAAAKRLSRSGSTASDGDVRDGWKEKCFAMDDYDGGGGWKQRCFAVDGCDDDGVWEALVEQEGLFWFGSFWGRTEQGDPVSAEDQMYAGLSLPVVLERVRD